jgi:5-methylcytosine-specific restriction endonuclease McrA
MSKKIFSIEHRKHLSEALIGNKPSDESKRKNKEWHTGRVLSQETKDKMSKIAKERGFGKWMVGKKATNEQKEKMRLSMLGKNRGKKSEETKKKISISKRNSDKTPRGEKAYQWQGGKSFIPYSLDWTDTLKRSIRERDRYTCQICNKPQGDEAHDVHHIDYNKLNCNPKNLITLCRQCHAKTSFNREYWIEYFNKRYE